MMEIWDDLSEDMRKKLVGTFRECLKECIKNKGGLVRFKKEGAN
jgi:hypothetical protein